MNDYTGVRCPKCATPDVFAFERTRTGRAYYCHSCGNRWKVTLEDEVLTIIDASLTSSSLHRSSFA
jgi:DNA-directed RNA polymerase subunit RPC12/RpoP